MINITKHLEFFNPLKLDTSVHIIGVGAIGSTIAEMVARLGLSDIHIYDFDTVEKHNIANQVYFDNQVDKSKLDAIEETMKAINPDIKITKHPEGWKEGMRVSGYVFLAVDNIEIRKTFVAENKYNPNIKAVFDIRMGLESAQHFAADWSKKDQIENLLETMNFTHEEAKEEMPVSACGTTLSVITTIRMVCSVAISNFINFVKEKPLKIMILVNAFEFTITAF